MKRAAQCAVCFVVWSAYATTSATAAIAVEGFNYPNGALASHNVAGTNSNATTGTAWNFGRTAASTATSGAQVVTGDLAYPAYTGLAATADGHKARPTGATYSGNGYDTLSLGQTYAGTAYYSLVLNVSNIAGQNFARGANGSFLAGFHNGSTPPTVDANVGGGLAIKSPDNNATASAATRYILGIQAANVAAASRAFHTTTTFVQGESVFLVVEYLFNGGGNDTVNLYLNPPLGAAPPATPSASSSGDFTGNQDIQSFVLRSNSTLPFGVDVDNVQVGETWGSVTTVPEPGSMAVFGLMAAGLLGRRRRRER